MAEATQFDLHGIEKQPFPNFGEDWSYLERVTVKTAEAARTILAAESGMNPDEHDPLPIFMRWTDGEDTDPDEFFAGIPDLPCWLECPADHPAAVPFWKNSP
jgi:hypothetical protein